MSEKWTNRLLQVVLYTLSYFLLREWLMPVMELSDTDYLELFLLFIALTFLLYFAQVRWWISGPIKLLYIFSVLNYIYLNKVLFTLETSSALLDDIISNFMIILNGNWDELTNPFRTVLFFLLLWMTTYLIRHWIEVRRNILLFYAMTVIFIAFMDTFSGYSGEGSVFRIMISGLLLLGILTILKLTKKSNVSLSGSVFVTIAVPLLFVLTLGGVLANVLPIQSAFWPDPVSYITSKAEGAGEKEGAGGIAKSGYDPNDSALGGPFVQDDTLIFEADVERRQYWKIETKNTYTSKGWEQIVEEQSQVIYEAGMDMGELEFSEEVKLEKEKQAQVAMSEKYPFLMYPYGLTKAVSNEDVLFLRLEDSGQYRTLKDNRESSLDSYELSYVEHDFSLKRLRETSMESLSALGEEFSEYLQLPEELPERVKELALATTENAGNVYDKTRAIERYFARSGFVYDRKDVAIPEEQDDYVDQFLFDTKRGYCDNFSTSMVVMLRSVGIPARWVKGFAPGDLGKNSEGQRVYKVTNNEAHSWVEAYMPGIGWMPFEPTIGFNGTATIDYDIELEDNDPEVPEQQKQAEENPEKPEKEETKMTSFDIAKSFETFGLWVLKYVWVLILSMATVTLIIWQLFKKRIKWMPKLLISAARSSKPSWDNYSKQYKRLLKQLDRFGLPRKQGVTLSAYAVYVDSFFGGSLMKELTHAYEKGLYGDVQEEQDWQELMKVWEDLINRTSG
ncbi:DUF4129 domain-containing transglutaminase family protein [Sporosarcina sp. CAU 1771]